MGGLRIRNTSVSVKSVTALDAFPKVPETYVKTSKLGGSCMTYSIWFRSKNSDYPILK